MDRHQGRKNPEALAADRQAAYDRRPKLCCCCIPIRVGIGIIGAWWLIYGVVGAVVSFLDFLCSQIAQGVVYCVLAVVGILGMVAACARSVAAATIFAVCYWVMTIIVISMTIAILVVAVVKHQDFIGNCNGQDYTSSILGNATTIYINQDWQKYYRNVLIGSIVISIVLALLNFYFAWKACSYISNIRANNRYRSEV
ncbi:hypothetical protein BZG36_05337, partial [Bifiguratus adelaidae]